MAVHRLMRSCAVGYDNPMNDIRNGTLRGGAARLAAIASLLASAATAAGAAERSLPYWASISAGQARMRTGPGRNFPASWLYQRADLPVKVIETYPSWRKIEDPDGAQGWMMVNLLSDKRTAVVLGEVRSLHAAPDRGAPVAWRVEPGVIGKLSRCVGGWCLFDVHGRKGYIEAAYIWGVAPGETVE